nr:MAG TPA: hypothetical protein [Caudoviricetes sp.]
MSQIIARLLHVFGKPRKWNLDPKNATPGGYKKITKYFLGRWKNFLSSKPRQLGGFSYFFSFITISKSSPNASAICRISFSEKLSRFIFCLPYTGVQPSSFHRRQKRQEQTDF